MVMTIIDRLCGSFRHIAQVDLFDDRQLNDDLIAVADHLESGGALHPRGFGHYFLFLRLYQEGDHRAARQSLERIRAACVDADSFEIRPYTATDFTTPQAREMKGHFVSESLLARQIHRIPHDRAEKIVDDLSSAAQLIKDYAPVSNAEFTATTREIIPALGIAGPNGYTFDGCSSVERWGSILVNMKLPRSPLHLSEVLIHESSHSALFSLTCEDHRVLNPPTELYSSPLRYDARPLDGIYHAVFVLARMYRFLAEVAQSSAPADIKAEAKSLAAERAASFHDGHDVLVAHAQYTEVGQAVMQEAAAVVPVLA